MDYRQLVFYQKAQLVVQNLNTEIKRWPKTMQSQEIARQLFRSAISVGANIAEGHGRHDGAEYIHFLTISQGSANEVDHWLNTALACEIGNPQVMQMCIEINNEVRKMLFAAINTLRSHQTGKSVREPSPPYSPDPFPLEDDSV